jgi:hypothetical protein
MVGDAPATSLARSYESRIEKEFGGDLRYALFFSRIMHSYPRMFLGILARQEQVLERYLEVGSGEMFLQGFHALAAAQASPPPDEGWMGLRANGHEIPGFIY